MECIELKLRKYMKKVRNSQAAIPCTEISELY